LTLLKALTGGGFDRLNWQYSGEFDQNFSKKSNAPGFARGGGMGGFGIDRYIKNPNWLPCRDNFQCCYVDSPFLLTTCHKYLYFSCHQFVEMLFSVCVSL